ncbi:MULTISPECIES: TetR/AcrR family transcriptional regulator [Paenibacillus]|uniref:TetR/AcrR family transcriptional regulator n=1 Tax=Paenibacillus xylanilyticus TaxID=248903 RepID=A0A7Y6BYU3_9BACL|nr:TetR/AcrR family transcriptional regulator [Paenibacillus xylanilyticus]NUU77011.1 TetR/AcrR family transcriptional regulator [Paenibacillus xylanilyticus]
MNPIHEMNEKKKLIITTALKLFSAKGSAATSMQEIAELCGMSKGSLYLMFKSKEELEASTMEYCIYTLMDEMSQIEHEAGLTSRERLHKQIETLLVHVSELKEFLRVQLRSIMMDDEQHPGSKCNPKHRDMEIRTLHWFKDKLEDLYGPEIEPYTVDLILLTHGLFLSYVKIWFTEMPSLTVSKMASNLLQTIDYAAYGLLNQRPAPLIPLENWPAWTSDSHTDSTMMRHPIHIIKQMQDIVTSDLTAGQSRNDALETIAILKQEMMEFTPRRAIILGMMHNLENIPAIESLHSELQHILDAMYSRFIQADSSHK